MVTEYSTSPGAGAQPGSGSSDMGSANQAETGGSSNRASGQDGLTVTIPPAGKILSTSATAMLTPIAIARRVLPANGGLPLYAGLGGLALVGVIDWPVAVAAGAGYGLARLVSSGQAQPAQTQHTAAPPVLTEDSAPGPM